MPQNFDLTVAAIIERDNEFLTVEEHVRGYNVLNQPAGHIEPGESILDAAVRETLEETGYHFTPRELLGIYVWTDAALERTFFRIALTGSARNPTGSPRLDYGIICTHWLTKQQLLDRQSRMRSPMVLRCVEDYIAGIRYPIDTIIHIIPEVERLAKEA